MARRCGQRSVAICDVNVVHLSNVLGIACLMAKGREIPAEVTTGIKSISLGGTIGGLRSLLGWA